MAASINAQTTHAVIAPASEMCTLSIIPSSEKEEEEEEEAEEEEEVEAAERTKYMCTETEANPTAMSTIVRIFCHFDLPFRYIPSPTSALSAANSEK